MCDSIVVKETSNTQAMQPSAVFIITELITELRNESNA